MTGDAVETEKRLLTSWKLIIYLINHNMASEVADHAYPNFYHSLIPF